MLNFITLHLESVSIGGKVDGSPRYSPLATLMRSLRAKFKLSLRGCRVNKVSFKNQAIAEKLTSHDFKGFRTEISSMSPRNDKLPHAIDGAEGESDMAEYWKDELENSFNCGDSS